MPVSLSAETKNRPSAVLLSLALALLATGSVFAEGLKPTQRKLQWGIYQDIWGENRYKRDLEQVARNLEATPSIVLVFRDLKRGVPKKVITSQLETTFIISLELHEWGRKNGTYLEQITGGEYDAFFRTWAKDAAATGRPIWLRFGFEMSGQWFSWSGKPELFRQAWIRVHKIFQEQKATNVKWMFAPNVLYGSQTFTKNILPYYPGDAYVDLLGLDGYNFGDNHSKHHRWETYAEIFEASIAGMKTFPKPLWISEIGCADGPKKSLWLADFLERAEKDGRVEGFVYFNYDKRSEGEPNWALDSDPGTLKVFKDWVKR